MRPSLQLLIEHYGDRILADWHKMSRENRLNLLHQAAPGLYTLTMDADGQSTLGRDMLLVPHLANRDDLCEKPWALIAQIHNRIHHLPEQWAAFDADNLALPFYRGLFDLSFIPMGVVMYGQGYGSLVPWDTDAAHRLDIMGYPIAHLIIESQCVTLRALGSFVIAILNSTTCTLMGSTEWNGMSLSSFNMSGDAAAWSSYHYQRYGPPPNFSVGKSVKVAQSCFDSIEDQLWLLQTDPAYLKHHLKLVKPAALKGVVSHLALNSFVIHQLGFEFGTY